MANTALTESIILRMISRINLKGGKLSYDQRFDRAYINVAHLNSAAWKVFQLPDDFLSMSASQLEATFIKEVDSAMWPGGRDLDKSYSHWGTFAV